MTNRTVPLFILAIALVWIAVWGSFQAFTAEATSPAPSRKDREEPAFVEIDAVTSATTRYLPVLLDHREHVDTYQIACETCHDDKPTGDLKVYYHRLCLGCHRAKEEDPVTPPDCFSCHMERQ